jgi:hypothetical protein
MEFESTTQYAILCCVSKVELTHLLMGFELQLYEPADYAMIHWCVTLMFFVCYSIES